MKHMILEEIEKRFKEITKLSFDTDLTCYPLTQHIGFEIRMNEKKENGEVFTPLELVDKMLEISKPQPNKFNMDLCAGHGQFTIRMLRKFVNEDPDFDIDYYLQNLHWFNEYNVSSCKDLLYIFGDNINLAVGPAQQLKSYPSDMNGIWCKGIYFYDEAIKKWLPKDPDEIKNMVIELSINKKNKVSTKSLF